MTQFGYDHTYVPPAPSIEVRFGLMEESFSIGPVKALVDTGADATLVPAQLIRSLKLKPVDRKTLRSQWGEARLVNTYYVDVGIANFRLPGIEVIADPLVDEIVIGRTILNKLTIHLYGPAQTLDIEA